MTTTPDAAKRAQTRQFIRAVGALQKALTAMEKLQAATDEAKTSKELK